MPQRASAGRPFRYCRDNDDQCLRAARNARMRQRNAPGLAGQVAQAFEVVDRLDRAVETLTEALHTSSRRPASSGSSSPCGPTPRPSSRPSWPNATRPGARPRSERGRGPGGRRDAAGAGGERPGGRGCPGRGAGRPGAGRRGGHPGRRAGGRRPGRGRFRPPRTADALDRARQALAERDEARSAAAAAQALRTEAVRERDPAREATTRAERARDEALTEARLHAAAAQEATARADAAAAEQTGYGRAPSTPPRGPGGRRRGGGRIRQLQADLRTAEQRAAVPAARVATVGGAGVRRADVGAAGARSTEARQDAAAARAHADRAGRTGWSARHRPGPVPRPRVLDDAGRAARNQDATKT